MLLNQVYNRNRVGFLLLAILLLLVPVVIPSPYIVATMVVIGVFTIVCTGMTMLLGLAGQISLGHAAFYGIGAYTSAYVSVKMGLSPWLGILIGCAIAAVVAYIVGLPTLKLKDQYLALATLGFGIIVQIFFKQWRPITGGSDGFLGIPSLEVFGVQLNTDERFYFLVWIIAILGLLFAHNVVQSSFGRALRSIHGSEIASDAIGVPTHKYKVQVFVVSAIYGSIGGSLYAHYVTFINPQLFDVMTSINFLIMVIIGGAGYILGSFVGALAFVVIGEVLKDIVPLLFTHVGGEFQIVLFGVLLVALLIIKPDGLTPLFENIWGRLRGKARKRSSQNQQIEGALNELAAAGARSIHAGETPITISGAATTQGTTMPLLEVDSLRKVFGGLTAIENVSFAVNPGEIVALIGPNGAGKTTLFNMITAVLQPTSGTVTFMGRNVTGSKPYQIAELGITRTFQNLQVFGNMSVVENVMTGAHSRLKSGMLSAGLRVPSVHKEEHAVLADAMHHLANVGLLEKAFEDAHILPYGHQRLLEIARAAASRPKLILLDEPMAGLNPQESKELVDIILKMRTEGISFLFVEHDMETVMAIADRIVVLDYGKKIAEGTPSEIVSNPLVIAAYLGEEDEQEVVIDA